MLITTVDMICIYDKINSMKLKFNSCLLRPNGLRSFVFALVLARVFVTPAHAAVITFNKMGGSGSMNGEAATADAKITCPTGSLCINITLASGNTYDTLWGVPNIGSLYDPSGQKSYYYNCSSSLECSGSVLPPGGTAGGVRWCTQKGGKGTCYVTHANIPTFSADTTLYADFICTGSVTLGESGNRVYTYRANPEGTTCSPLPDGYHKGGSNYNYYIYKCPEENPYTYTYNKEKTRLWEVYNSGYNLDSCHSIRIWNYTAGRLFTLKELDSDCYDNSGGADFRLTSFSFTTSDYSAPDANGIRTLVVPVPLHYSSGGDTVSNKKGYYWAGLKGWPDICAPVGEGFFQKITGVNTFDPAFVYGDYGIRMACPPDFPKTGTTTATSVNECYKEEAEPNCTGASNRRRYFGDSVETLRQERVDVCQKLRLGQANFTASYEGWYDQGWNSSCGNIGIGPTDFFGRILNFTRGTVKLLSKKVTTPSLNVKVCDTTYYGDMRTDSTTTGDKLRLTVPSGVSGITAGNYAVFDNSFVS